MLVAGAGGGGGAGTGLLGPECCCLLLPGCCQAPIVRLPLRLLRCVQPLSPPTHPPTCLPPPHLPTTTTKQAEDFRAVGRSVLQAFHDWLQAGADGAGHWALEPVNHEGWRVSVDEGQGGEEGLGLLRQSLHDPLLVLNVESDVEGGEAPMREHFLGFLRGVQEAGRLDMSALG